MKSRDLKTLRKELDTITEELMVLLEKRRDITMEVAEEKKKLSMPILDRDRENVQLHFVKELAKKHNLDPNVMANIFSQFVDYCKGEMEK